MTCRHALSADIECTGLLGKRGGFHATLLDGAQSSRYAQGDRVMSKYSMYLCAGVQVYASMYLCLCTVSMYLDIYVCRSSSSSKRDAGEPAGGQQEQQEQQQKMCFEDHAFP